MSWLHTARRWVFRNLIEDWRLPFTIVTILASIALFSSVYFFVTLAKATNGLCDLNANRLKDKASQIANTREYLQTPLGMQHNGLNDFIRSNSLPRLEREFGFERREFPDACRDHLK